MPFTVLVVDGEKVGVKPVVFMLAEHYRVITAAGDDDMLAVVGRDRVDVVVLAVRTREGLNALSRLRAIRPFLEVILLSASRDPGMVARSLQLGAAHYLAEPFDDGRLLDAIGRAAGRRRAEQARVVLVASRPETLAVLDVVLRQRVDCVTASLREITSGKSPYHAAQLVVLDVDGERNTLVEAVRALRAQVPRVAVLAVTADVAGTRAQCARSSLLLEGLVAKPYRLDHLLDRVATVLTASGEPVALWRRFPLPLVAAIHYIAEHYRQSLTTDDVARAGARSASRLAHLFTEVLDVSVHAFINRVRVEVARSLLVGTARTLPEIAEDVGFSDASHLSRVFTCCEGVRPGEYRRQASLVLADPNGWIAARERSSTG